MKYRRIVIFGGSSGIGLATAEFLHDKCEELITLSRRPSSLGKWIKVDITDPVEIERVAKELENKQVDGLLYLGGTWESNAFTDQYNFESCTDSDLQNVLDVNLLGPMRLIQKLLPNLRLSKNPKIVITGAAIADLSLGSGKEVANTSSMIGLRGLVLALRENLKNDRIGVTLIKPGYVATPEVIRDFEESNTPIDLAIPLEDIFTIIESILKLSNRTNINEIEIPTMIY